MRNLALKLIALVMAGLTWLTVHQVTNEQQVVEDVPLEIRLPEGWAVLERSVDEFEIGFRGAREDILKLNKDQVRIEFNVTPDDGGRRRRIALTEKNVVHPGNARVVAIVPNEVDIVLDERIAKRVPLKTNLVGRPEGALEVDTITVMPERVVVTGSRTVLEPVEQLVLEPIELAGRLQTFEARVPVLPPSSNWVGTLDPERVLVKVRLVEKAAEHSFTNQAIRLLLPNARTPLVKLEPETATVRVRGREEVVASLKPEQVSVYADATRIEAGRQYELKLHVHVPAEVEVVDISPAAISVDVGQ